MRTTEIQTTTLHERAEAMIGRAVSMLAPTSWNFATCPQGGVCVMVQRPGSGPAKCRKCGRTM